MKTILALALSLLSVSVFAQRYATNVIKHVDYQIVEETNDSHSSVFNGKEINYRTVRVTDHKKKENGILSLQFDWKKYYLEIDRDVYHFSKDQGVKSSKLQDIILTEKECNGSTLIVRIQSKTIDPVDLNEEGVIRLTKTKTKTIKIDAKKYCNGFMPTQVIIKTL